MGYICAKDTCILTIKVPRVCRLCRLLQTSPLLSVMAIIVMAASATAIPVGMFALRLGFFILVAVDV